MENEQFDFRLIHAAMARAGQHGWRRLNIVEAARDAGLPLAEARSRFPFRSLVLLRIETLADKAALVEDELAGSVRERLFDLLMRRIDVLQQFRGGIRAVLRATPSDPGLALLLAAATNHGMTWIAQAAGLNTSGLEGKLRVTGLAAVWLQALRAWDGDDSADLAETMAALDKALATAERVGRLLERPIFRRTHPGEGLQRDAD